MIKELSSDLKNLLMMRTNKVKKKPPELSGFCFVINLCVNNRYFKEEKRGRIAQKGGQKKINFMAAIGFVVVSLSPCESSVPGSNPASITVS